VKYVLDLNLVRRHLNESQRAMVAARLATLPRGVNQHAQICAPSQRDAAELLNVSRRTLQYAHNVQERAIPAIAAAVQQGQMPVSKAAVAARLSPAHQQQIADEMASGKSVLSAVLAATRSERVEKIERPSAACPLSELGRTYPVLLADPPWKFESWSAGGQQKAAEMHYPTMSVEELCALPVSKIAARDAVLFCWAVPSLLEEALVVIKAWGFKYKTNADWVKPHWACGHWFRGRHEHLLVATRGDMPPPPHPCDSVFMLPAPGPHSDKPPGVRNWIAHEAYPRASRIELFARDAEPGWAVWGLEAPQAGDAA
jgi:N6-adenosine-specific RNA methylase IME4